VVFGRRRRQEAAGEEPGSAVSPATAADGTPGRGPWDSGEDVPPQERIDLGSLLVPAEEGAEIQVSMADDQAAWVSVVRGDSGLQLQAFAAPKSGGLWDDVRAEIAAEIAKAGGRAEEAGGPFGVELRARVTGDSPVSGRGTTQAVRFLGVDGPRWFLRGVISGPAAEREELAAPLERVFAGVVVVRGDHPAPPRDLLEIRLPEQARQAIAGLAGPEQEEAASRWAPGPFERGPEITETR
jgi:uncharacterized protein DUF3710